jgi:tetraprenyl-beta-curcumene synthase
VRVRRWSSRRSHSHRVVSSIQTAVALARAAWRELTWGLPGSAREVARWRARAAAIPDAALRADALEAIERKRANIDGAVLFSTIAQRRSTELLRLLVAFEVLADYLDCTSERGAFVGVHNGRQLHLALIEALEPDVALSDYYSFHPWCDDGGFVATLVQTCRQACVRLPSYDVVRPFVARATALAQVLALNHEEDAECRDALLRAWAAAHPRLRGDELVWFEWTGGASAWLTVLALLALAADDGRVVAEARVTFRAYMPWISLAGTLLDSYGDHDADVGNGAHSYVAHYPSPSKATQRIAAVIRRALAEASSLHDSARHRVLVSSMAAMYLSKDSARAPQWQMHTRALIRASGPLTWLLVPALRAWRIVNKQQAT